MNIDVQIIYIIVLLFTSIVLLCITLMYLYITTLNKYTKVKDDPIIENAEKIAKKIVESAKNFDKRYDKMMISVVDQVINKWSQSANDILNKNVKVLDTNLQNVASNIYKKETSDLALYKKEKMSEFDRLLAQRVNSLSKQIISREIDLGEHKALINASLERAKAIGLFK